LHLGIPFPFRIQNLALHKPGEWYYFQLQNYYIYFLLFQKSDAFFNNLNITFVQ
jgi:hypothetical protein